jgi:hypothetical protein
MSTAGIHVDDLVLVDKRNHEFLALVTTTAKGEPLGIRPLDRRITYRTASGREVVGHWRKRAQSRLPAPAAYLAAA